ncbi:FtsX-like permease family protein [Corynebacterium renale]|uniref:Putative ABC transport system permease protein n=2 Tax=Corynebacterium renale TaxID=1724 RepID=A0A2A9DKN6_9CORY|nr:ABC transporter permease [Corynebacterium renale]PFG27268.1 putative ABC transport system permease protein [Corynebacterium renale]SQI23646.1 Macrolide export ATP-binding/permease macB [Corynebacterium renale]
MYLALRDIRRAKGRFSLITAVIALMTFLLVMLSGLTNGLSSQNTSAVENLDPDAYILSEADDGVTFTQSRIDNEQRAAWSQHADKVVPLGITQTRLETADSTSSIALFGLPDIEGLVLPDEVNAQVGDTVTVGGQDLKVADTTDTYYYSHTPTAYVGLDTWKKLAHSDEPTALMAWGVESEMLGEDGPVAGTQALKVKDSFDALPAYSSERGSLVAMQVLLYGISALIIVAFLSVWTLQRIRDIAVLRALGASTGYVLKDAVSQAAIVVIAGVLVGGLAGTGLGLLAANVLPFELSVVIPMVGVGILGIAGSVIATRKVASVDPELALGA